MLSKKTTGDYVDVLAKQYGLPKSVIRKLLIYGTKNICRMIKDGEDVQLQHFGSIYFDKKAYANYIKAIKKSAEEQVNNQSTSNDLE